MPGVVASGHPRTSAAALDVLAAGGNAFDAIVAAGFAAPVAEPALTSLGGGGFLLARTAAGRTIVFDFFVDTPGRGLNAAEPRPHFVPVTVRFPGSEQIFNVGLGAAAVPGALRGLLHAQRRLGRLPLAEVVAPAARLAREGLTLNAHQAYFLRLLHPIMTLTAAGRALFEPHGRYLGEGDHLANPDYAAFLESLPEGGDRDFYQGALAARIARDMREGAGLLTEADLGAYAVVEREPLAADYRGCRLLTNPPPSFGGALIGLSLRLLQAQPIAGMSFGSAAHLTRLAAVMEEVDRRRAVFFRPSSEAGAARVRTVSKGTTHVSVCDSAGNAASLTLSNGEACGYVVPGTGILLNNMMGEDDLHPDGFHASPPGVRVSSMMAPSLLLRDGEVQLVIGSGGSKRIRTALLQVVSNRVDFRMSVPAAVEAPRIHWDGNCIQAEPGFAEAGLAALERRWPVNRWPVRDLYFGGVHAVAPAGEGAGDPRRGGHAAVPG